ncbi:MAG: dual specificity protein phosphatase family protein [Desulfobacteraceae bacterium]|nr:dual specificity protein phosphatase family protein [Desulfobacteraceae bacterium]
MAGYKLNWITRDLAVGYAPMSYEELDSIRGQGIDAIVNLCGEFCDLHEIERQSGFEVYYLPIPDETAPDMEKMEKALAWLDEAIYLGKKVLVHCRHGIGRTGTFVTAYLVRRGFGLKFAVKKLEATYATPANYEQWRLLKKYGEKTGELKVREPSLESRHVIDLTEFFAEYEALAKDVEEKKEKYRDIDSGYMDCGRISDVCCHERFKVKFIEAVYINNKSNKILTSKERLDAIGKVASLSRAGTKGAASKTDDLCPLNMAGGCRIHKYRPIRCRSYGIPDDLMDHGLAEEILVNISQGVFFALSGAFPERDLLEFPFLDVISGRFIQTYFNYLLKM